MRLKLFSLSLIGLLFLASCSRDDDNGDSSSGLQAFLDGRFNVDRVEYNGNLTPPLGSSIPLVGLGENTDGFYQFNQGQSATYRVNSTMRVTLPLINQEIPIPIVVDGQGEVSIISETRFTIDDPRYGLMTYDVEEQSGNSLTCRTNYETDTLGSRVDLNLEIFMSK
jgi:hypothetical protein